MSEEETVEEESLDVGEVIGQSYLAIVGAIESAIAELQSVVDLTKDMADSLTKED